MNVAPHEHSREQYKNTISLALCVAVCGWLLVGVRWITTDIVLNYRRWGIDLWATLEPTVTLLGWAALVCFGAALVIAWWGWRRYGRACEADPVLKRYAVRQGE